MLAPEPSAEEGRAHALPFVIAPGVIDVFPRCVRLAQQANQGVMLVVPDDAQEGVTLWQAQDLSHLPHQLLRLLYSMVPLCFLLIRLLQGGGGSVMRALG